MSGGVWGGEAVNEGGGIWRGNCKVFTGRTVTNTYSAQSARDIERKKKKKKKKKKRKKEKNLRCGVGLKLLDRNTSIDMVDDNLVIIRTRHMTLE